MLHRHISSGLSSVSSCSHIMSPHSTEHIESTSWTSDRGHLLMQHTRAVWIPAMHRESILHGRARKNTYVCKYRLLIITIQLFYPRYILFTWTHGVKIFGFAQAMATFAMAVKLLQLELF